ncbi:hypothetical protein B0H19DRAFT_1017181 [Mycena capillaripes]|nr:hypothetical protein B0H19DRAFT_1017181 [Mycena capillaripes]
MSSLRCHQCGLSTAREPRDSVDTAPGTRHHILLNSNEPPLDSDIPAIESAILETDAQLPVARLDDEIARQRERLQQLEEAHASLSSYRARNRAILSPLRKMPPEVLGEIFSRTLLSINECLGRKPFHTTDMVVDARR